MRKLDLTQLKPLQAARNRQPVFRTTRNGIYMSKMFAEKYNLTPEKKIILFEHGAENFVIASYNTIEDVPYQLRNCIVKLSGVKQKSAKEGTSITAYKIDSKILAKKYNGSKREMEVEIIDLSGTPALLCKI